MLMRLKASSTDALAMKQETWLDSTDGAVCMAGQSLQGMIGMQFMLCSAL